MVYCTISTFQIYISLRSIVNGMNGQSNQICFFRTINGVYGLCIFLSSCKCKVFCTLFSHRPFRILRHQQKRVAVLTYIKVHAITFKQYILNFFDRQQIVIHITTRPLFHYMNVLDNGVHFLKDYLDRYAMKAWFIRDVNYIRIRTNINTLNAIRSENKYEMCSIYLYRNRFASYTICSGM